MVTRKKFKVNEDIEETYRNAYISRRIERLLNMNDPTLKCKVMVEYHLYFIDDDSRFVEWADLESPPETKKSYEYSGFFDVFELTEEDKRAWRKDPEAFKKRIITSGNFTANLVNCRRCDDDRCIDISGRMCELRDIELSAAKESFDLMRDAC